MNSRVIVLLEFSFKGIDINLTTEQILMQNDRNAGKIFILINLIFAAINLK